MRASLLYASSAPKSLVYLLYSLIALKSLVIFISITIACTRYIKKQINEKALKVVAKHSLRTLEQDEKESKKNDAESKFYDTEPFFNKGIEAQHLNFAILLSNALGENKMSIFEAVKLSKKLQEALDKENKILTKAFLRKILSDNPDEYKNLRWLYIPNETAIFKTTTFHSFVDQLNNYVKKTDKENFDELLEDIKTQLKKSANPINNYGLKQEDDSVHGLIRRDLRNYLLEIGLFSQLQENNFNLKASEHYQLKEKFEQKQKKLLEHYWITNTFRKYFLLAVLNNHRNNDFNFKKEIPLKDINKPTLLAKTMQKELSNSKPMTKIENITRFYLGKYFSESALALILNLLLKQYKVIELNNSEISSLFERKALIIKESLQTFNLNPDILKNKVTEFFDSHDKLFDIFLSMYCSRYSQYHKIFKKEIKSALMHSISELLLSIISVGIEKSTTATDINKTMFYIISKSSPLKENSFEVDMNKFIPLVMKCIVKDEDQINKQGLCKIDNKIYLELSKVTSNQTLNNLIGNIKTTLDKFNETRLQKPLSFLQRFCNYFAELYSKKTLLTQFDTQITSAKAEKPILMQTMI